MVVQQLKDVCAEAKQFCQEKTGSEACLVVILPFVHAMGEFF